jgi:hypothetical protein
LGNHSREPESPAGPAARLGEAQGYSPGGAQPAPYRGYYYRKLNVKTRRRNSPFTRNPAEYGLSGIITFIVNQDRAIYRKNLGRRDAKGGAGNPGFKPATPGRPES